MDVRCSDRNRIIAQRRILIATDGPATAELSMRYSMFNLWLAKVWFAFMDESQQYGHYHEIASPAAIQQPALIVFVGDRRQTPGGLQVRPHATAPKTLRIPTPKLEPPLVHFPTKDRILLPAAEAPAAARALGAALAFGGMVSAATHHTLLRARLLKAA